MRFVWLLLALGACENHTTAPTVSIVIAPDPTTSTSVSAAPLTPAPPPPSPRCLAACRKPSPDCAFCRSHQIGAPPEHFAEYDESCSRTCQQHYDRCLDACARDAGP